MLHNGSGGVLYVKIDPVRDFFSSVTPIKRIAPLDILSFVRLNLYL